MSEATAAAPMLPMIERRRIEAEILKHVYDTLSASHGKEVAAQTLAQAVRSSAIEQAAGMAAEVDGKTSMRTFIARQAQWRMGGVMDIAIKHESDERYAFDVTRCGYAEMYREMGLGEIGHLLSCQRDGSFCEGYDPRLQLTRTQTLMGGATHCDFDYTMKDD